MANIVTQSKTTSSITVYVANLDTGYSFDDRYILWYLNNSSSYTFKTNVDAYKGYSPSVTFTNLSAGTTYTIKAVAYYNYGTQNKPLTHSETTLSSPRPSNFSWSKPKVSGQPFNLTAKEWNDLTANINQVRAYKNYSQISFTNAVPGNPLTYSMYNQVVDAIKGMKSSAAIYKVEKGWIVYDWRLNDLVDELNSIS